MNLRHLITDTIGLACLLAICLLPLGLYKTDTGFGWFWPGVGGYHFETDTPSTDNRALWGIGEDGTRITPQPETIRIKLN